MGTGSFDGFMMRELLQLVSRKKKKWSGPEKGEGQRESVLVECSVSRDSVRLTEKRTE